MGILNQELRLPNGHIIKNRVAKAAMDENMAEDGGKPSKNLIALYRKWSSSGAGLMITGNVMIDSKAIVQPHNVVIESNEHIEELRLWASAAQENGGQLWMQLNHPGRQVPEFNGESVSASDIEISIPGMVPKPRALELEEIKELVVSFGKTASIAKASGFSGVQIHAAHGFLVNQFLSPLTNVRTDKYGGSLENRARFLMEIYDEIRAMVGQNFPVAIKINSADFQKGGFDEEESLMVIEMISNKGIDLIEVSGGTYEAPAMMVGNMKESTKSREAFFKDFVVKARNHTSTPIMLTGGMRTKAVMEKALINNELDLVGAARPFIVYPSFAMDIIEGNLESADLPETDIYWYGAQLQRMAQEV